MMLTSAEMLVVLLGAVALCAALASEVQRLAPTWSLSFAVAVSDLSPTATPAPTNTRRPSLPGPVPARRRVTLALHASVHDALPVDVRAALHRLALGWYVQGERVETALSVEVRSDLHRAVVDLVGHRQVVEIPAGASRCWVCGCVEAFACPRGCGWHTPLQCTRCARATASVPRAPLRGGALSRPLPSMRATPAYAIPLAEQERSEREGRESPVPVPHRRQRSVRRSSDGAHVAARALVIAMLEDTILPGVEARALPVERLVVLVGFGRALSRQLRAPLDGDPDELVCLALERDGEVPARLPEAAARQLLALLARAPRAGLCAVWIAGERIEVVHLPHVTDAVVAGRRAS